MSHWRTKYPELVEFLETKVRPVCDPYGVTYYNALDTAYDEYGLEGLYMQLPYIAANLLPGKRDVEKELTTWAARIRTDVRENTL